MAMLDALISIWRESASQLRKRALDYEAKGQPSFARRLRMKAQTMEDCAEELEAWEEAQ